MQGAAFKLTALAASLAVGFVVLVQVQQGLDPDKQRVSLLNGDAELPPGSPDLADPFETVGNSTGTGGGNPLPEVQLGESTAAATGHDPWAQFSGNSAPSFTPSERPTAAGNAEPFVRSGQTAAGSPSLQVPPTGENDPFAVFTQQLSDRAIQEKEAFSQRVQQNVAELEQRADQKREQWDQGIQQVAHQAEQKMQAGVVRLEELSQPVIQAVAETVENEILQVAANFTDAPPAQQPPAAALKKPAKSPSLFPTPAAEPSPTPAPASPPSSPFGSPKTAGSFNPFSGPEPTPPGGFPSGDPEMQPMPGPSGAKSAFPSAEDPATVDSAQPNRLPMEESGAGKSMEFPGSVPAPRPGGFPAFESASPTGQMPSFSVENEAFGSPEKAPTVESTPAESLNLPAFPAAMSPLDRPETPDSQPAMPSLPQSQPQSQPAPAFFDAPSDSDTAKADEPYRLVPQFNSFNDNPQRSAEKPAEMAPLRVESPMPATLPAEPGFGPAFDSDGFDSAAPRSSASQRGDSPAMFPGVSPELADGVLKSEPPQPAPFAMEPDVSQDSASPALAQPLTPARPENPFGAMDNPVPGGFPNPNSAPREPAPFGGAETPAAISENQSMKQASPKSVDEDLIGSAQVDDLPLESIQQPKIELYKSAPENAALGQPLVYSIEVVNTGDVAVRDVTVEDQFPAGTKLTGTIPRAELVEKTLVWKFPELKPGERKKILVRVVPIESGNLGSISTVSYKSVIAAQTMVTAPQLDLLVDASQSEIAVGESVHLKFVIENSGKGDAVGVILHNLIPAGLEHPAGADLEYEVGTLKGGEKKEVTLALLGTQTGTFHNQASLKSTAGQVSTRQTAVNVIPAVMTLTQSGPTRRFVGHAANYQVKLKNNSSRNLKGVTVTAELPEGFEFKSAEQSGVYQSQQRTVQWNVEQLNAGQETEVALVLIPRQTGVRELAFSARTSSGHHAELNASIKVEGFAALAVRVPEDRGPVAKGDRTSLRFRVVNRGSAESTRVVIKCKFPEQLEYISANGPAKAERIGQMIQFSPLERLDANAEVTFDLVFSAVSTGDARVEFEVTADQVTSPLRHQEQVLVFGE